MPKFDASSIAESLEYDFTEFVKGAEGTIAEPTDEMIGIFLDEVQGITKEAQSLVPADLDMTDAAAMLDAMNHLEPGDFVRLTSKMSGVYARLCSGHPTEKQIQGLPMRVRRLFFNWIQEAVLNPEAATGAGSGQGPTPLSAVAG
jgi:hypothetical protein